MQARQHRTLTPTPETPERYSVAPMYPWCLDSGDCFRSGDWPKHLGFRVSAFRVLAFRVSAFRVLAFRVSAFRVLGF